ncbi:MAG: sensor histidine kinase [Propioniciclava sp.]
MATPPTTRLPGRPPTSRWSRARRRLLRVAEVLLILAPVLVLAAAVALVLAGRVSLPLTVDQPPWYESKQPTPPFAVEQGPAMVVGLLILAGMAAALTRRRWPLTAVVVAVLAMVGVQLLGVPGQPLMLYVMLTIGYFAIHHTARRTSVVAGASAIALIASEFPPWEEIQLDSWFLPALWVLVGAAIGSAIRSQRLMVRALEERAERAESAREELVGRSVAEDRVRVARELHDIIAHHVSAMGVQAGSAAQVIDTRPDLAKELLRNVRESGARVLDELQAVLGVLRQGESLVPTAVHAGRPDLSELLDTVGATGVDVTVAGAEYLDELSAEGYLAAYRILQESLTNAHRHAPGAPVLVRITSAEDSVSIRITNGPADRPPAPDETGRRRFGLIGMRERVDTLGGELSTGPTATGGFAVEARIPGRARPPIRPAEEQP